MKYNFDKVIDRRNTKSLKYDFAVEHGKPKDVLPLWVADMDFPTSEYITRQLQKDIEHGIFGYSDSGEEYFSAVRFWYSKYFDWQIKKEWLIKTPGVVFAIAMAVQAYTNVNDAVLIQKPVYYPFASIIKNNKRRLINNSLVLKNGHYEIDFVDFERKIAENAVKLFILCSPHNPVGRVWRKWELEKISEICVKYGVIVVSDEIHSDFTFDNVHHHVLASINEEIADQCIICTSPSKTFNIAGLQVSNVFIPNAEMRGRFAEQLAASGYSQINMLGLSACQAAYEGGREWFEQLKEYLIENLNYVRHFLNYRLPEIKLIEPEGTYLIWLDFRCLKLTDGELETLIVHDAKLWLDRGRIFGDEGRGFERINIACPRDVLRRAFKQLEAAVRRMI